MKVGDVQRTLISVSRINEFGWDARLRKLNPHLINEFTGEVIPLRKEKGMFLMEMWMWVPTSGGPGNDPGPTFGGPPK